MCLHKNQGHLCKLFAPEIISLENAVLFITTLFVKTQLEFLGILWHAQMTPEATQNCVGLRLNILETIFGFFQPY